MTNISGSSAVIHSTQFQTVTESTYTLAPKTPIIPIYDDPEPVVIGTHDIYSRPLGMPETAGHHINMTV